jgi:hypothetical protein
MKVCDVGQHEVTVLFHSRKPNRPSCCKNCYRPEQSIARKEKVATKVCIKAKHYVIAKVSRNRQDALKTYRKRRDDYFKEHPICEFPDCNSQDITLHHMKGRIGAFLTDIRYFKSLCGKHHRYVEENPLESFKLRLSVKRLDK